MYRPPTRLVVNAMRWVATMEKAAQLGLLASKLQESEMRTASIQPDPVVMARLYGAEKLSLQRTLEMLYARRDHLDVLIALIEAERAYQKATLPAPPSRVQAVGE